MTHKTPANWLAVELHDSWGVESEITLCGNKGRAIIISGLSEESARLIAAAPDLLEALKAMRECYMSGYFDDKAIDQTVSAITKAEGKQ